MSDLISRQAAIDAIRKSASEFSGFMEMEMYTDDDAVEAINGVPSAEPVRHGRWVVWDEILAGIYHTVSECSECGFTTDKMFREEMPYCPHCGARMDKE